MVRSKVDGVVVLGKLGPNGEKEKKVNRGRRKCLSLFFFSRDNSSIVVPGTIAGGVLVVQLPRILALKINNNKNNK